jgi:putative hydrolase of the HAD superfamily
VIKAIVFDCFGVLVGRGFGYTYRAAGGNATKDRAFIHAALRSADLGGVTLAEFDEKIAGQLRISVEQWREMTLREEQLNIELVEYIASSLKPLYKIGLISNAASGLVESRIPEEVFKSLFDSVVISADVGLIKPDPAIFKYAADDLGVACSEILFVDDVAGYINAATQLEIKGVLYKNVEQCITEITKLLEED